ncbi:DUF6116 family protein [Microbulbifer sp. MCCC 1A16149]|uniref:DUF6116 family protein n=1 Tax=Microbulbifer sp. MCCC 1A16149 TaxID=3411322 RepID=UPI003D11EEF9
MRNIAPGTFGRSAGQAAPGYTPITVSKAVPVTIYMKRVVPSSLVVWFLNYARRLKHPQLFKWICALFLIDLIIPDLIPFVDEILLGLATLFLASWKKRGNAQGAAADRAGETQSSEIRREKVVTGHAEKMNDPEKKSTPEDGHGKH